MSHRQTLDEWLDGQVAGHDGGRPLADAIMGLADGARRISARLRQGDLVECPPGDTPGHHGALELSARTFLREGAKAASVAHFTSKGQGAVDVLDNTAPLALAVDPLDAAAGLNANVTTGTIFSIFPKASDPLASFLRPGREQLAAGYAMYGGRTQMVLTLGQGTAVFTLDPSTDRFLLTEAALRTPEDADAFAINAANYRFWEPPVRAYIDDCIEGADGPRDKDFKMRWVASLVAETNRILTEGGIFLYPRDNRPEHGRGTLRRVFAAVPIAFVAEQSGGAATDGAKRLLDTVSGDLDARAPLVFGSRKKVERVQRYHEDPDFVTSEAPLFGVRGLFRG